MILDQFRRLYAFNRWANRRIVDKAAELEWEEMNKATDFPRGSLLATLVHVYFAEWIWLERIHGRSPLGEAITIRAENYGNLAELDADWSNQGKKMTEFLESIDEQTLQRPIRYTNSRGKQEEPLSDILFQLLFHGMQHRAEVAQMLTDRGHSPGDIDYIVFAREQ